MGMRATFVISALLIPNLRVSSASQTLACQESPLKMQSLLQQVLGWDQGSVPRGIQKLQVANEPVRIQEMKCHLTCKSHCSLFLYWGR